MVIEPSVIFKGLLPRLLNRKFAINQLTHAPSISRRFMPPGRSAGELPKALLRAVLGKT
jgi:hypothetical protein